MEVSVEDQRVSLRGDASDFQSMASALRSVALGERSEAKGVSWHCRRASDPIRATVLGGESLAIAGGTQILALAAWFEALSDRPGSDVEVRWYPGHPYLSENSVALHLICR